VTRWGRGSTPHKQTTSSILVKGGWCKEVKPIVGKEGGRPALRWHVNPVLFGSAETAQTAQTPPNTIS
jgi:hypothetical protein